MEDVDVKPRSCSWCNLLVVTAVVEYGTLKECRAYVVSLLLSLFTDHTCK